MESCGPTPLMHDAAFEFIDGLDCAVLDEIVHIAAQKRVCMQRVLNGSVNRKIVVVEEIPAMERLFDSTNACIRERNVAFIVVYGVVDAPLEVTRQLVNAVSEELCLILIACNDQRDSRLVDKWRAKNKAT
jgi:hypothetical protein